jgi:CBS domain containing-hemolysin-like protein
MTLLFLYLSIAIGVSFLCSVLEAVLLSLTPSYIATISKEKPKAGKYPKLVTEKLDESLSAILILNTFAHTMGAAGVGSQALQIFGPEWEVLIAVLLTLCILYFSEIIPKTLGATFWRQLAIPASLTINWLVKVVYPLVWISTRLTKRFKSHGSGGVTREEVLAFALLGQKHGTIFEQENVYLSNLLNLREIETEQILTPRTVTHGLQEFMTVSDALDNEETRQFTRMPVYNTDMDDVTGKVIRADLFEAERAGKGEQPIRDFAKPIFRVSERLPVQQLLDLFIKQKAQMFLVEDQFGQTAGVVTLEDAIETLIGREIVDERDKTEDMQALAREKYRERLRNTQDE